MIQNLTHIQRKPVLKKCQSLIGIMIYLFIYYLDVEVDKNEMYSFFHYFKLL